MYPCNIKGWKQALSLCDTMIHNYSDYSLICLILETEKYYG